MPFAGNLSECVIDGHGLKVAPEVLFALQRLEQRLEVSGAEALGALPLNDLVEERRTVLHRLREYLQQISFLVPIDQDSEIAYRCQILVDLANPLRHGVVVSTRDTQELDAVISQF